MKNTILVLMILLALSGCTPTEETEVITEDSRVINDNPPLTDETNEIDETSTSTTISGTIQSIDTSGVALDGPAIVTIKTADNTTQEIHVPSMGIRLCAAYENIADVYSLKEGDKIEVRGILSEDAIVPCQSAEDYLKVTN